MKHKYLTLVLILFPLIALGSFWGWMRMAHMHPSEIHNHAKEPLAFKDNAVQCPQCHMYLVGKTHTAQVITAKGRTEFFDDIGCVILWLNEHRTQPSEVSIWAFSHDTNRYIDAKKAHYSDNEKTPMVYGFSAYETPKEGRIDFETMRLRMLRGESMQDPRIRKKLLGE